MGSSEAGNRPDFIQTATLQYLGVSENNKVRHVLEFFRGYPETIVVETSRMGNPYYIISRLAETYFEAVNTDLSKRDGRIFVRDRFLVGILFWAGLRDSEVILLKKKDVDLISKTLNVPTLKQRKSQIVYRPVPLDHVPTAELRFWNQYFELNRFGSEDLLVNMSARSVERSTHRLLELNPHALRHGLGLFLYEFTKDVRLVAQILRHTNMANTMIYTRLSLDGIREKLRW